MKRLFSAAWLCLSISAFAQPLIPYTLTASQFPNAANVFWVLPGHSFTLTYKVSSQIGTNARTYIKQDIAGAAVLTSLGTIPAAPDKLYLYDVGPEGMDRTLTIPANTSKSTPRKFTMAFDRCFYISAPTIEARPQISQLGGAFGFLIYQVPANSKVTNTGTSASKTSVRLYYSIDNGNTWLSWSSRLSAQYESTYLFKAVFSCSSTTNLGKFSIKAFGKNQVIYDTQYEWVSTAQNFRGDATVKFSASVSNYPIDL